MDSINRQDAIDAVHKNYDTILDFKSDGRTVAYSFEDIINALPSTQQEPQWIPVEEKLPEDTETVLITHRGGTSFGWYNGRYWERGAGQHHRALKTVTAWMPMPNPYKGGDSE